MNPGGNADSFRGAKCFLSIFSLFYLCLHNGISRFSYTNHKTTHTFVAFYVLSRLDAL